MKWNDSPRRICFAVIGCLFLSACQSTSRYSPGPVVVGPVAPDVVQQTEAEQAPVFAEDAVFLDVAVPTFSPGFPMLSNNKDIDYYELEEQEIWPQLRRTEAKLFAVETKNALEASRAFGSVRVVPDANTTADIFVLGTIIESDSENVEVEYSVIDATGELLGRKTFDHTVSENFFRDQRNAGVNPYQPLFDEARNYILSLIFKLSEERKKNIQQVALMRFASYYNPEAFGQYVSSQVKRKSNRRYMKFYLEGLPADDDPMLERIKNLRLQEMLFVDRLQDNYDTFYYETEDAYSTWQSETLPEIVRLREARNERNLKAGLGVGLAVLAGILASKSGNSSSSATRGVNTAGAVLAGVGSISAISDAFRSNAEMKVQNAIIEEQGEAVDLTLSPTEMQFEEDIVELQGTASEQYTQWKQYLREIYLQEATPDTQL
jgi:hypothetical protein